LRATAKAGEKVNIQLVGAEKWTPMISLSFLGANLAGPSAMTRKSTDGKITTFEYEVPKNISEIVPVGASVTVVVTEPLTGFFDQSTFNFTATSLDDLAGQIASQAGGTQAAKDAFRAIQDVKGSLATGGDVGKSLEVLKQKVERIPRAIAESSGNVKMRESINDVAEQLNTLAGDQGYDFSQLMQIGVEKGLEKSESIKDIRKKTDTVQGATEVMQMIMENKLGGIDEPVVHVIYQ